MIYWSHGRHPARGFRGSPLPGWALRVSLDRILLILLRNGAGCCLRKNGDLAWFCLGMRISEHVVTMHFAFQVVGPIFCVCEGMLKRGLAEPEDIMVCPRFLLQHHVTNLQDIASDMTLKQFFGLWHIYSRRLYCFALNFGAYLSLTMMNSHQVIQYSCFLQSLDLVFSCFLLCCGGKSRYDGKFNYYIFWKKLYRI